MMKKGLRSDCMGCNFKCKDKCLRRGTTIPVMYRFHGKHCPLRRPPLQPVGMNPSDITNNQSKDIKLQDMIGKKVRHKSFGEGTVIEINKKTVTIAFAQHNAKFPFQQVFKKYLAAQQKPLTSNMVEHVERKIPIEFREPIEFILKQLSKDKFDTNDNIIVSFIRHHIGHKNENGKDTIVKVPYNVVNMCMARIPEGEAKNKFRVIANCLFTINGKNKRDYLRKNCRDEEVVRYCQEVERYVVSLRYSHHKSKKEVNHWYRQITQRGIIGLLGGHGFYK